MKQLLLLLSGVMMGIGLNAQDVIYERNGHQTEVEIIEVTHSEASYRLHDDPEGPVIRLRLGYIHKIVYENGSEQSYSQMYRDAARGYDKRKEPALAALFSALLPGAGQYYNEDVGKAAIMGGVYVIGGIVAIASGIKANDLLQQGDYYYNMDDFNLAADYYGQGDHYNNLKEAILPFMGAMWLWSVIDAPIRASMINQRYDLGSNYHFENENFGLRLDPYMATHSEFTPGYRFMLPAPVYGAKLSFTLK
ncbi:MAG: DUF5683 domain-containing protein [Bacteroidota bacterium]